MVMMWDDHETANDSWSGGAENHDPAKEGPWARARRRRSAPIANGCRSPTMLGELRDRRSRHPVPPETRLTARSRPPELCRDRQGGEDIKAALMRFRDGPWRDPERTMMGSEQEAWLAGAFKRSAGQGTRWQLLAQQTVMGSLGAAGRGGAGSAPTRPNGCAG
jgi:alkaline phosphatase D